MDKQRKLLLKKHFRKVQNAVRLVSIPLLQQADYQKELWKKESGSFLLTFWICWMFEAVGVLHYFNYNVMQLHCQKSLLSGMNEALYKASGVWTLGQKPGVSWILYFDRLGQNERCKGTFPQIINYHVCHITFYFSLFQPLERTDTQHERFLMTCRRILETKDQYVWSTDQTSKGL